MSKKILFEAIKAKVDGMDSGKYPRWNCPALFNNQFVEESTEDPIRYPAVFVQFEVLEWRSANGTHVNMQVGEVEVTLHIGFKRLEQDKLDSLDLVDALFAAIQGLAHADGIFSPLRRIRERQDVTYNNVEVWQQVYRCDLVDCSALNLGSQTGTIDEAEIRPESSLHIEDDVLRSASITDLEDDT